MKEEYQVHLGLKSGKEFSFMVHLDDVKTYINEIQNAHVGRWFSFISDDFIKYSVEKNEISSIGISMNKDEILEQDKRNAEIEKTLSI